MTSEIYLGSPEESTISWIKKYATPFHFEVLEDGHIQINGITSYTHLLYSFDNKSWNDWDCLTGTDVVAGQKFYIKNKNNAGYFNNSFSKSFSISNTVNVAGNIMSLIYNNFVDKTAFKGFNNVVIRTFSSIFQNCSKLIDAAGLILPATNLPSLSYYKMFYGCTNLIKAPKELPNAITDSFGQYYYMFNNCTSLTTAPKIYLKIVKANSFSNMFNNCTNITELHYSKELENNSKFIEFTGSPWFGATNATVYYDL